MKCPFCNQELDIDLKGECGCINEKCQKSVFMFGSEELWQELIRTKKQLEFALNCLDYICKYIDCDYICGDVVKAKAKETLEEITALEQKDVK